LKKIQKLEDATIELLEQKFIVAANNLSAKELESVANALTALNRSISTRRGINANQ